MIFSKSVLYCSDLHIFSSSIQSDNSRATCIPIIVQKQIDIMYCRNTDNVMTYTHVVIELESESVGLRMSYINYGYKPWGCDEVEMCCWITYTVCAINILVLASELLNTIQEVVQYHPGVVTICNHKIFLEKL